MWKNLDLNPLDEPRLRMLMHSQHQHGHWGGLIGRPVKGGRVEQAFGHHRLEAARRLRIPEIQMMIGALTDDHMLNLMAVENATQSGAKPGNALEIVYAVTTRLAEVMLFEDFWRILQKYPQIAKAFADEKGFVSARGRFEKGEGCGRPIIMALLGNGDPKQCPYSETAIKEAIATLKMMGELPKIAEKVIAANERTMANLEEQRKQAETEAEKEREIGRGAKARAAEDRQKGFAARISAIRDAPKNNAEKSPQLYDGECNKLFPKDSQLSAFRTAITSGKTGRFLEVKNQFGFAENMMDTLTSIVGDRSAVKPQMIVDWVAQHLREATAKTGEELYEAKKAEWIANTRERLISKLHSIKANAKVIFKSLAEVDSIMENNHECEELHPEINRLAQALYAIAHEFNQYAKEKLKKDKSPDMQESHDWDNNEGLLADDIIYTDYEDISPKQTPRISRRVGCS